MKRLNTPAVHFVLFIALLLAAAAIAFHRGPAIGGPVDGPDLLRCVEVAHEGAGLRVYECPDGHGGHLFVAAGATGMGVSR